ncbi:MAG: DUF3098 domain-containing protein [Flavobacteriales bacterium]|nr:DUF3098 domain-containing protein [Flavobacteriales bacterium]
MPFTLLNYRLLLVGIVIIILGFVLMSGGGSGDPEVFDANEIFSFRRITLAPLVALAGYLFIIYAILVKPKA